MPVNYASNELQLSGVVTNAEFRAATSTDGLSLDSDRQIYVLEAPLRFLSGVDCSGLQDLVIEMNDQYWYFDAGVSDTSLNYLTFISSTGRSVSRRQWAKNNGGGFLRLNNCRYIHNVSGGPGGRDSRYLDTLNISSLSNASIKGSEFAEQEPDVSFQESGRIRNLGLKRAGRLVVDGSTLRCMFINPSHYSRGGNGGYIGLYSGASVMMINYVPDKTLDQDVDNYNGQVQNHWLYWLGTSADNFSRGSNNNSLVIKSKKNQMRNVVGGIRYYEFVGAEGATVNYFDSVGSGKQPFLVDLTRADMLNTNTDFTLPANERVEIVTRAARYGGDTSWVYTALTGQEITVTKYGKEITTIDVSTSPTEVVGSEDLYIQVLVKDDSLITEEEESKVTDYPFTTSLSGNKFTIEGDPGSERTIKISEVYDKEVSRLLNPANYNHEDQTTITRVGAESDCHDLDVVLKNCMIDGSIKTTGTVIAQRTDGTAISDVASKVTGTIIDSTGDSLIKEKNGGAFSAFLTIADRLSNTNHQANNVTNFKFNESDYSGQTFYVRLESNGLYAAVDVEVGVNEFDLGVTGEVAKANANIELVKEKMDTSLTKINEGVKKASNRIPYEEDL